jgi:hypothetical protein
MHSPRLLLSVMALFGVAMPSAPRAQVQGTGTLDKINRVIETRWQLQPLGTRDAAANDMTSAHQPSGPTVWGVVRTTLIAVTVTAGVAMATWRGYLWYRTHVSQS